MIAPLPPLKPSERAAAARGVPAAPRGAGAAAAAPSGADQQALASQRQAFDFVAAERAEIEREHEILDALLMAQLKNEDEITKKWIALI